MSFFSIEEISNEIDRSDENPVRVYSCESCKLHLHCKSPKMGITGEGRKGILVVTGPATHIQDQSGGTRAGTEVNYLRSMFAKKGIDLDRDCFRISSIRCYTKDKEYGVRTMDACSRLLHKDVALLHPKVIVTTCSTAWEVLQYDKIRGRAASASYWDWTFTEGIPDQDLNTWVIPMYDTAIMMAEDSKQSDKKYPFNWLALYYDRQIDNISTCLKKKVPIFNWDDGIEITESVSVAKQMIEETMSWKEFSFDFETWGLRAQAKGMSIWCMSVSNIDKTFAFKMHDDLKPYIAKLLTNSAVKTAHNAIFERTWSMVHLGVEPTKLTHDPMIGFHIYHTKMRTSLKFLAYAECGILGYDDEIDQYLKPSKADKKLYGANALNTINKAPQKKLLKYNGMDSKLTHHLKNVILRKLDPEYGIPAYRLYCGAIEVFTDMSINGFRVDTDYISATTPVLEEKLKVSYDAIMNDQAILRRWDRGAFKPGSDADVRHLLFDIFKFTPIFFTDKSEGKPDGQKVPSVDEEALSLYIDDCSIVEPLLEYRRWYKALGTFIGSISRESTNGMLHGFFKLNTTETLRSSSSDPNLQNLPKRDEEVYNAVRACMLPHKGHKIAEYDFAQLEVRGAGSITRDRNLLRYLSDKTSDQHKDMAVKLFIIKKDLVTKKLRQLTKTQVFLLYYGGAAALMATNTWKEINSKNAIKNLGLDVKAHLSSCGINTYEEWLAHCEVVWNKFWDEDYPDYKKYRDKTWADFKKTGCVYYPIGATYKGPSGRNPCLNAPIQGSSFAINLWAMIHINKEFKSKCMNSKIIAQVHDSLVFSVDPAEEELVDYIVWKYMTQAVKEDFDWVCVELETEKSISKVNESWAKCKEDKVLHFAA